MQEATIVLVGRSAQSEELRTYLKQVGRAGISIDYQQVDVGVVPCAAPVPCATDGPTVHALIQKVLAQYGHLDGIIHAAGVLHNTRFFDKTEEEVRAVLAPKVIGVELLDEASSQIPLDFFLLCSSLDAVLGGVGYVDYAGANAYLDAFAHTRAAKVLAEERQGRTLSINWPYWKAGGMQMNAETMQMMRELVGEEPMETEMGMKTLYQALASDQAEVIVLHGQVERIKQQLLRQSPDFLGNSRPTPPVESVMGPGRESEQEPAGRGKPLSLVSMDKLREALSRMVCDLLKVQMEEIDVEMELSEYGFDSITLKLFANRLNQSYQLDLTPAHFYEYSTIERLALYLQRTSAAILTSHFVATFTVTPEVPQKDQRQGRGPVAAPTPREQARVANGHVSEPKSLAATQPIAIIGMSGAFPQARDIQSFWSNLLAGKDCISEIPASRWDWPTSAGSQEASEQLANVKWAGVMEGIEWFDPQFFGISPREAEQMDPQQRLLMMYVWKAIEDAGYAPSSLSGTNTALFVGTASSGYGERLSQAGVAIEGYSATGLAAALGPNRMSHFLNLHGPS